MNILKEKIKLQIAVPLWKKSLKQMKKDSCKKAILIGTPVHGNLGDHAIALEERNFLLDNFSEYHLYEIFMPMYHLQKRQIRESISEGDIIFISGGGWMGNLWIHNENVIREILLDYPDNQIIIFPQTIFYTNDKDGKLECEKTKRVFTKHNNLLFCLREEKSYNFVEAEFVFSGNSKVRLYPDMALYGSLLPIEGMHKEKKINICLRNDREAFIGDYGKLIERLAEEYHIVNVSTVVPHIIPLKNREKELYKVWKIFADAEFTITDRLHAMLFSILNGTPCIALDNRTGKVFGVAKWIEKTNLVVLVNSLDELFEKIQTLEELVYAKYNREKLEMYYKQMVEDIRNGGDK